MKIATTILGILFSASAFAGPKINLNADGQTTVKNDLYTASFYYEGQGKDPAEVSQKTVNAINNGLTLAGKESQIKATLGNAAMNPQYRSTGKIGGWSMRAELNLESTASSDLSKIVAKLQETLMVSQVSSRPSDSLMKNAEDTATKEAIAAFKRKANLISENFGKKYKIVSLNINQSGTYNPVPPMPMMMMEKSMAAPDIAPLPMEGKETKIVVSINGQIELDD